VTTTSGKRNRKHFQLDASKIKRAKKALGAKSETETIEGALDLAITEQKRNRLAWQATQRCLMSDVEIRDVYGVLAG
jgi:hypothetical protein